MDLIYQGGKEINFNYILTPYGKTVKTKSVSVDAMGLEKLPTYKNGERIPNSEKDVSEPKPKTAPIPTSTPELKVVEEPTSPWTILELKDGKYTNAPEQEKPVVAILQWLSGKQVPAIIKYGNYGDHCWKTVDDNSELSYSIDVIKWMYVPKY